MNTGRLAARLVIGGLFVGHGLQKLEGAFDGPGIDDTAKMMDEIGMKPGLPNAYAAALTETAGGAMLVLGAATPLAAASLIGTMITAIRTVHGKNGPWITNRGWEYNAVLIAALLAIVDGGPGPISIDAIRRKSHRGPLAMIGALGLGAAASTLVVELGRAGTPQHIDLTSYEPKHATTAS
ncbi:MAG TPA: DoxX family protein [Mycobacteriales bacterium]|nr:DoxX family protein [Mycobacteriales bacterium]